MQSLQSYNWSRSKFSTQGLHEKLTVMRIQQNAKKILRNWSIFHVRGSCKTWESSAWKKASSSEQRRGGQILLTGAKKHNAQIEMDAILSENRRLFALRAVENWTGLPERLWCIQVRRYLIGYNPGQPAVC